MGNESGNTTNDNFVIKKRSWLIDLVTLIVFENQYAIKFTQKRNYRNTNFLYLSYLNQSNWLFFSKHSAFQPTHLVDIVGYNHNLNIFFITQTLKLLEFLTLHNINILNRSSNLILVSAQDKNSSTVVRAYPSASFYEREVAEMFPIQISKMKDSRNLLLEYSTTFKPLVKSNSVWGESELTFQPAEDTLVLGYNTVFTI